MELGTDIESILKQLALESSAKGNKNVINLFVAGEANGK